MDNCIVCGKETIYSRGLDIQLRETYIEGCGQLCGKCYEKIFMIHSKSNEKETSISNRFI